jgi:hypothetical protein
MSFDHECSLFYVFWQRCRYEGFCFPSLPKRYQKLKKSQEKYFICKKKTYELNHPKNDLLPNLRPPGDSGRVLNPAGRIRGRNALVLVHTLVLFVIKMSIKRNQLRASRGNIYRRQFRFCHGRFFYPTRKG